MPAGGNAVLVRTREDTQLSKSNFQTFSML